MADEPTTEQDAKPDESVEAKPRKGSKQMLLLVTASAMVMVLTPLLTILTVKSLSAAPAEEETHLETVEILLPKVQVNVAGTNATRYAQIDIVAELSTQEILPYFQNQDGENPDGQLRRMMASVITITSSKDLNGLITAEAKESLSSEICEELNRHLQEIGAKGMVVDVYFSGFLIQ